MASNGGLFMYSRMIVLMFLVVSTFFTETRCSSERSDNPCPCKDPSLCDFIKTWPKKELFAFQVSWKTWKQYDWSQITTVASFKKYDAELMCYAHSRGARLVLAGSFPVANLTSAENRTNWVKQQVATATQQYMDGINIDFENVLSEKNSQYLIALVNETARAFRAANPYAQISFDVPYGPGCTWGRCYDYEHLAALCDFLVIMDYDLIDGFPFAVSNDRLKLVKMGIQSFQVDGVPADKLVAAVPWYGFDFPCTHLLQDNICSNVGLREGIQRDFLWKYGSGTIPRDYAQIVPLLKNSTTGRVFNETFASPFFNYLDPKTGQTRQVWYDDPASLSIRFNYAKSQNLRGVSMWTADKLDYSDSPEAKELTAAMWDAINSFFK